MITDIYPAGKKAAGASWFLWFGEEPPSSPPTLAEVQAATVLDLTCYLMADGTEIGMDQAREDDTRACHNSTSESFGATTFTKESILHIVDPQEKGLAEGNKARELVKANATQYCGVVNGIDHETGTVAAAALMDVYRVECGEDHISPAASGKFLREVKTSWSRVQKAAAIAPGP